MRSIRRLARIVPAVALLALVAGQAACVCGYDLNQSPCASMRGCSDWDLYGSVLRGENPCAACGVPSPCGPCAPCAPPCAPPPCAPPPPPCAPAPCAGAAGPHAMLPPDLPPAKPGETWCRVEVPATYCTVYDKVETQCGRSQCIWVPPVTETRTHEVCVCPPCAQDIEIPGVYRSVPYCHVVCPARSETQYDSCGCPHVVEIPAQTETCLHEICIQPPTRKVVYQPARYETKVETCDVVPGYWKRLETPPVCEMVPRQVCAQPSHWEWRRNTSCTVPPPPPQLCTPAPAAKPASEPAPAPAPAPATEPAPAAPATPATPAPTPAPEPAPAPTPTPEPAPTPAPAPTPEPTPAPTPAPTPEPTPPTPPTPDTPK